MTPVNEFLRRVYPHEYSSPVDSGHQHSNQVQPTLSPAPPATSSIPVPPFSFPRPLPPLPPSPSPPPLTPISPPISPPQGIPEPSLPSLEYFLHYPAPYYLYDAISGLPVLGLKDRDSREDSRVKAKFKTSSFSSGGDGSGDELFSSLEFEPEDWSLEEYVNMHMRLSRNMNEGFRLPPRPPPTPPPTPPPLPWPATFWPAEIAHWDYAPSEEQDYLEEAGRGLLSSLMRLTSPLHFTAYLVGNGVLLSTAATPYEVVQVALNDDDDDDDNSNATNGEKVKSVWAELGVDGGTKVKLMARMMLMPKMPDDNGPSGALAAYQRAYRERLEMKKKRRQQEQPPPAYQSTKVHLVASFSFWTKVMLPVLVGLGAKFRRCPPTNACHRLPLELTALHQGMGVTWKWPEELQRQHEERQAKERFVALMRKLFRPSQRTIDAYDLAVAVLFGDVPAPAPASGDDKPILRCTPNFAEHGQSPLSATTCKEGTTIRQTASVHTQTEPISSETSSSCSSPCSSEHWSILAILPPPPPPPGFSPNALFYKPLGLLEKKN